MAFEMREITIKFPLAMLYENELVVKKAVTLDTHDVTTGLCLSGETGSNFLGLV